jgi:hypothetical protein
VSAIHTGLEPSPEFESWVASLDPKHWAKHDLSACRLGWKAGCASLATELLALRKRVGALVHWLENNQPDVFRRGLWDAVNSAPQDATQADRRMENLNRHIAASPSPQKGEAGVRDGIEIAAQWHEAEAERIRLLALDSDEPHRFHEAQDDHLSHAALIRALPLPTPKEPS